VVRVAGESLDLYLGQSAEIWNYQGAGTVTRQPRERERWMLLSRGKSGAAVSVAGKRGAGYTTRSAAAERRGCTRIMEKRWRAQSRLSRRAFAFARRVFAAQFRSRRNCTRIHPHSSPLAVGYTQRRVARAHAHAHAYIYVCTRSLERTCAHTFARIARIRCRSSVQSAARSRGGSAPRSARRVQRRLTSAR